MKIDVSLAKGLALDWLAAYAMGMSLHKDGMLNGHVMPGWHVSGLAEDPNHWVSLEKVNFSTDWSRGGKIIDLMKAYCQEKNDETGECYCSTPSTAEDWHNHPVSSTGPTPLVAAVRCYVISRKGDFVELPDDLGAYLEADADETQERPRQ